MTQPQPSQARLGANESFLEEAWESGGVVCYCCLADDLRALREQISLLMEHIALVHIRAVTIAGASGTARCKRLFTNLWLPAKSNFITSFTSVNLLTLGSDELVSPLPFA